MTVSTSTLQEIDPVDLTTVLFDYSSVSSGTTVNPGSLSTTAPVGGFFGLSAPSVSVDTSDRTGDGVPDLAFSFDEIVQSSFRMRATAADYDSLRTGIGYLQRLLSSDGVVKWVPLGSSNTYYIYRKPSSIPALFSGADGESYERLRLFDTPQGLPIIWNRERLLRGPTLLASVNPTFNPTLLIAGSSSSGMQNWAWDSTTGITTLGYGANVNWANQSYRFTIATTATRNFQGLAGLNIAAPGDVWTLSFYVKASGGSLAKAQAVLDFINNVSAVLATATGTLTTLSNGGDFVRVSVTSAAAPATTAGMRLNLRMANGDTTSYTVDFRRVQTERAATASTFRVGPADVVGNSVTYGADGKTLPVYNPGDAGALMRLTLSPSSGAKAIAYDIVRRAESTSVNLAEAINNMSAAAHSYRAKAVVVDKTMYGGTTGDTSSQADGSATDGGPSAKTTFTNQTSLVRRWRWVSTPTDPKALHGRWAVYCAIRPETNSSFRVCMHWQAANRDPVTETEDVIYLDATDVTDSQYTPVLLGHVSFDATAGDTSLAIEGWAAQDSGSGALWWDVVYLLPADQNDQHTLLQVPGFRVGDQGRETWLGSELVTQVAGAITGPTLASNSTKIVLDTQYQEVGNPPATTGSGGVVLAAGRHVATVAVQLQENDGAATTIGSLRVRKAPGPGTTFSAWTNAHAYTVGTFVRPTAGNRNGRTYVVTAIAGTGTSGAVEPTWPTTNGGTVVDNAGANQITWTETTLAARLLKSKAGFTYTRLTKQVEVDADGSTAYEFTVLYSATTSANRKIHVLRLSHDTLRTVDDTYSMQMLGDIEVLQTTNGAVSEDELVKSGPFITLGPGLNVIWLDLWSLAPLAYDDMDPRDALAKHDPTLSTTVAVDIIPRYYG